jgi:hypothetical protein
VPALTRDFVKNAIEDKTWDFGNQVLYDLCLKHPAHERDDVIIAKVWLIGRAYAAAVERRRHRGETVGDEFYTKLIGPTFRRLDPWLSEFKKQRLSALQLHKKITDLLKQVSCLEKRSFASKYLHFHFPNEFYIYDSEADIAARGVLRLSGIRRWPRRHQEDVDGDYAQFFERCQQLSRQISEFMGRHPSPRELDKVLLRWNADTRENLPPATTRNPT